jgi:hypothetical protein
MIFCRQNFIEVFLELEDHSSFEIRCWNHIPLFQDLNLLIKNGRTKTVRCIGELSEKEKKIKPLPSEWFQPSGDDLEGLSG